MDCSEQAIVSELSTRLRLGDHDKHRATVKTFFKLVDQECGDSAAQIVPLLSTICYEMAEAGRLEAPAIYGGDHIDGGNKTEVTVNDDNGIHIGGNVINSQVGQMLTNCTNLIQQQPAGESKSLLSELEQQVKYILQGLPTDKKANEPEIADYLKTIVEQSTGKTSPNRKFYSVSADGLLEASKWVKDFGGNILGTIGQLGKLIWPDFSISNDNK